MLGSDTDCPTEVEEGDSGSDGGGAEYDELGFVLLPSGDRVGDSSRAYREWFEPKARRRLQRFEARRRRLPSPGQWMGVPKPALKGLLRKGVPAQHRAEVWWSILGCEARRKQARRSFGGYLEEGVSQKTSEEIERDLRRTFPNHRKFRTEDGRGELRGVLLAYASYAPNVQYCQGLNFIAALLLIVFSDQERAFWALLCAIESLGVEGYYTEGMTLLRADMRVFTQLLRQKCPKVAKCLSGSHVDLTSICSEWYITWFAKCLPIPTILRVWDTLFFEGFKILFRVAIGVFKRAESEVLGCGGFEEIMESAKTWPRAMVQHNELLKASFGGPAMRRRQLLEARGDALIEIELEDEERNRRALASRERALRDQAAREAAAREEALRRAAALPPIPASPPPEALKSPIRPVFGVALGQEQRKAVKSQRAA